MTSWGTAVRYMANEARRRLDAGTDMPTVAGQIMHANHAVLDPHDLSHLFTAALLLIASATPYWVPCESRVAACCCLAHEGHDGPHTCECDGKWEGPADAIFTVIEPGRMLGDGGAHQWAEN